MLSQAKFGAQVVQIQEEMGGVVTTGGQSNRWLGYLWTFPEAVELRRMTTDDGGSGLAGPSPCPVCVSAAADIAFGSRRDPGAFSTS